MLTDEQKECLRTLRVRYGESVMKGGVQRYIGEEMDAYIESLIAAAEAAAVERQWLPIESAPKDGTPILAYWSAFMLDDDGNLTDERAERSFVGVAHLLGSEWSEPDALNAVGGSFDDDFEYAPSPTHWQPLPQPPKAKPCPTCHGSGQICTGTSGQDDDGNAPILERCPECGYGDAP